MRSSVVELGALEPDRARRSARCSRSTQRPTVVLPVRDSPTSPSVSPVVDVNDTSETACTLAFDRRADPCSLRTCERLDEVGDLERRGDSASRSWPTPPARAPRRGRTPSRRAERVAARAARPRTPRRRTGSAAGTRIPTAGCSMFGGEPGIGDQAVEPVHAGASCSRPCVYGCVGWSNRSWTRRPLDDATGVHHLHAIGDAGDHAEVVGDQHDRRVELALDALRAPRGSAPAPSRRAPWSARRRSAPRGRWRSPSRSSRAGACRRRTRAGTGGARSSGCGMPTMSSSSTAFARAPPASDIVLVRLDHLDDLVADPVHRVERRQRILEDHRDLLAADLSQLLRRGADELDRRRPWPNRSMIADFGSRPEHAEERHRLAGAALADDADASRRGATSRSTPRTACTIAVRRLERDAEVAERQDGFSPSASAPHRSFGSSGVAQTVADEVDADGQRARAAPHGKTTSHQWPDCTAPFETADQVAERRAALTRLRAEAEERQRRLGDDGADDRGRERHEDRADRVGQQVRTTIRRFGRAERHAPPRRTRVPSAPAPDRARGGRRPSSRRSRTGR